MIPATPAHHQPAVRAGLRAILQLSPEISEVGDSAVALARTQALAPAVVLTDIRMPGCDPRGGSKTRACFPAAP